MAKLINMRGFFIPESILQSKEITSHSKLLLTTIASILNDNGVCCRASIQTLADKTGCDRKTVIRSTRNLEYLKLIKVTRAKGVKHLSKYELLWNKKLMGEYISNFDGNAGREIENGGSPKRGLWHSPKKGLPYKYIYKYNYFSNILFPSEILSFEKNNYITSEKSDVMAGLSNKNSFNNMDDNIDYSKIKYKNHNPSTEKKVPRITKPIALIIEYWKELGLKFPKDTKSKTYISSIKNLRGLLSGKLLDEKFDEGQIKEAIFNFSLAAIDNEYEPSDKSYKKKLANTYLPDFIHNKFIPNMDKYKNSLFLYYLSNKPFISKNGYKPEKDPFPEITGKLKKFYSNKILGGAVNIKFSDIDNDRFIKTTKRLIQFLADNKSNMNIYNVPSLKEITEYLCEAFWNRVKDKPTMVTPGWLCSDNTFSKVLPAYLTEQDVLSGVDGEGSIYRPPPNPFPKRLHRRQKAVDRAKADEEERARYGF